MPKDKFKNLELNRKYPEGSVGRHMSFRFPVVPQNSTVKEALDFLDREIENFETIGYVFVVDAERKLRGVVTIKKIFAGQAHQRLEQIMERDLVKVFPWTSEENVVLLSLQHDIKYIPVVDSEDHILGIYTTHALRQFLNKQIERKLMRASGIRWSTIFHPGSLSVWESVMARLPWILFGLLGGLFSGLIIGAFRSTLEAVIILALYIPVIMSTGANMANQSAMLFIRNSMVGNISSAWNYFFRELLVGISLGLIVSLIIFFYTFIFQASFMLAVAVSISIFITVILSALIGVSIPFTLSRFKIDPAMGAGPFLTTIKDIVSMLIYFTVASLVINFLR